MGAPLGNTFTALKTVLLTTGSSNELIINLILLNQVSYLHHIENFFEICYRKSKKWSIRKLEQDDWDY